MKKLLIVLTLLLSVTTFSKTTDYETFKAPSLRICADDDSSILPNHQGVTVIEHNAKRSHYNDQITTNDRYVESSTESGQRKGFDKPKRFDRKTNISKVKTRYYKNPQEKKRTDTSIGTLLKTGGTGGTATRNDTSIDTTLYKNRKQYCNKRYRHTARMVTSYSLYSHRCGLGLNL